MSCDKNNVYRGHEQGGEVGEGRERGGGVEGIREVGGRGSVRRVGGYT